MAKAPTVYPVSADLSALLGAAVDVDAAWTEPVKESASSVCNGFGLQETIPLSATGRNPASPPPQVEIHRGPW